MRSDRLEHFLDTLASGAAPVGPPQLRAVRHGLRGEWDEAHGIVQDLPDAASAWVHAWLHRIEGDQGNAAYWYRRAGRKVAPGDTAAEGRLIAAALMADPDLTA